MAARYFNWKLATVLIVAISVFAAAALALHQWQKSSRAVQALPLGEAAYEKQDYDEAATQYGRYLTVNAEDVRVLLKYADAQLKRRPSTSACVQQTISAYRNVLRLDHNSNEEAARRLIQVYLTMGAPGEAQMIAERYLETNDDVNIRRMLAEALWRQRKPKEAVAVLTALLEKHPDDVEAYERMGMLAEQDRDSVSRPAAAWFDDAIARNPQAALAYIARAGFRLRQQQLDQALADLEQARQCDLSKKETRLRLAAVLMSANALDQAREQLRALQAQEPAELRLWQLWAELAVGAKVPEEMATVARCGLEALAGQPWDFMPVAAELLIRSGHLEEAKACIARLRQKEIALPTTMFLDGMIAEKQGQVREAIIDWRKAITFGDRRSVVYLILASALARLGDTQAAISQLRTLVADTPNSVEGHLALAQLLVQTGDWREVLDQTHQVLQLSPGHAGATLLELQARAYRVTVDYPSAAAQEKEWQDIETRLTRLEKEGKETLAIQMLLAQVALMRAKYPEAESRLKALANQYPAEMKVLLLQADLDVARGNKEQARSRFEEAVTKFPQAFEPVRGLAVFLNQQDQRPACEAALRDGMARITEPRLRRDLGLALADFYHQWQQEEKLAKWLSELAAQFPSDIQSRRLLLQCEEVVKDPRRAQTLVDEVKTLEGEAGPQWRYEQARLWNRSTGDEFKARYPEIVKLLQENLLANPKDHASRVLLAMTYDKAGEVKSAVDMYREALGFLPDNVPILVRTIMALNRAKEFDEASRLLARAREQNPHDLDLERLQLEADLRQGKLMPAEKTLVEMIGRDPNDTSSRLSLALIWMQGKKYDEAQKTLDDLKTRMPDSVPVALAQVSLYVQQGKGDEAIRFCDQLVQKRQDAPAYTLRARTYMTLKQNEKAREDLGRIIDLDPKNAESWAVRADFYRATGRVRDGIPDIRKALELAPDNTAVQRIAVLLFLASNDLSLLGEAESLLGRALAVFDKAPPTNIQETRLAEYNQLRLLKVQVLLVKSTGPGVEEARQLLRKITESQPRMAEAWQWLAQLELSQEESRKAADVALEGLTHNPDNGPLLLLKARAEKVGQPAVAVVTLKGLLDQNPANLDVVIELADAYARAGRTQQAVDLLQAKLTVFEGAQRRRCEIARAEALYANGQRDEAKTLFDTLMKAEPNDPMPTMTLAQRLRKERRWTEMNQLVQRWLAAHPKDAGVATAIARVLAAAGDRQALLMGEDILRVTIAQNPQSVSPLMLLAMMMQDVGRNEEAQRLNRKVLELDPGNIVAMNNLAWVLCEEGRPEQHREALTLAEKGLQVVPDYVDLLDTRGYAYYRLNDFEKALADFRRCLELYPANSPGTVTPRFHLGMTFAAMQRRAEAVEQLQMALAANRTSLVQTGPEQSEAGRVTYAIKVLKDALKLQEQMEPLRTNLGLQGTGPSEQEINNAKTLLDQLQKGT
jgi:tetratricopeptide (TPR) repeat protein